MITVVSTCKYRLSEEEFVRPIVDIVKREGYECEIINYRNFKPKGNGIVICGTAIKDLDYMNYLEGFEALKDFCGKVLGICAGFNIIAKIFSNEIVENKKIGIYEFKVIEDNPLIKKGNWKAYFLQKFSLKNINDNLECLALHKDEVCMFKVKGRDFYCVSFYPEVLNGEIIVNFLRQIS